MSNHTSGPWMCDAGEAPDYSVGLDGYAPSIYAARPDAQDPADDPILLFVAHEPFYTVPFVEGDDAFCAGERYHGAIGANMSLAAAAPDLLAALEELLKCYDVPRSACVRAHEAIAKARACK